MSQDTSRGKGSENKFNEPPKKMSLLFCKGVKGKGSSQKSFVMGLEVKVISNMEQNGINLFHSVVF